MLHFLLHYTFPLHEVYYVLIRFMNHPILNGKLCCAKPTAYIQVWNEIFQLFLRLIRCVFTEHSYSNIRSIDNLVFFVYFVTQFWMYPVRGSFFWSIVENRTTIATTTAKRYAFVPSLVAVYIFIHSNEHISTHI